MEALFLLTLPSFGSVCLMPVPNCCFCLQFLLSQHDLQVLVRPTLVLYSDLVVIHFLMLYLVAWLMVFSLCCSIWCVHSKLFLFWSLLILLPGNCCFGSVAMSLCLGLLPWLFFWFGSIPKTIFIYIHPILGCKDIGILWHFLGTALPQFFQ